MELIETTLISDPTLKAYYRHESGLVTTDSSGNSKTLTNANSVGTDIGVYGSGADFGDANTNKRLYIGEHFGLAENLFTIGGWFKPNVAISGGSWSLNSMSFFAEKAITTIGYAYNSGNPQITLSRYLYGVRTDSITHLLDMGVKPHHIVAKRTNTHLELFVDGVSIQEITFTEGGGATPTNVFDDNYVIGTNAFKPGGTFNTSFVNGHASILADDVFVMGKGMTIDEIKLLSTNGSPSTMLMSF